MSDKPVIKIIGIGDIVKRCIERNSSESNAVAHMLLDRDASKYAIDEAAGGADLLWIAADAADSNIVAEIGRATSGALTIAVLKGTPDPGIISSIESAVDAYAFASSDGEIYDACAAASSLSGLMVVPGNVNVEMVDVKYIFRHAGMIIIRTGEGKDVADAARKALRSIDQHEDHAPIEQVLCRIDSDPDVGIEDILKAADIIRDSASPDALMLWGHVSDSDLHDRVKMVIAVGFKPIH